MTLGCCLELSPFAGTSEAAQSTSSLAGEATRKTGSGRSKKTSSRQSRKNSRKAASQQATASSPDAPTSRTADPERNQQPVARSLPADQKRPKPEAMPRPRHDFGPLENEPDLAPATNTRTASTRVEELPSDTPEDVRDYLVKMRHYDMAFPGDVILPPPGQALLNSVMARLERLQGHIGHGHFYLLGLDEAISYARRPAIGAFPRQELDFLENLFHFDAALYGFMDKKPLKAFTATIARSQVIKVPGMGNYIYKEGALKKWDEIRALLGDDVILTSGVRGVIKQFYLFLAKAQRNGGNMSLASRSLAPPGYSFHAVGDFDVGQRGFGVQNFMAEFTTTPVYQQLSERGYISLRYPRDNFLGVRFEPWHVKVTS